MPRSFLVKTKTKSKDERSTSSCDADVEMANAEDADVKDARSPKFDTAPRTTEAISVARLHQNNAGSIAREMEKTNRAAVTIPGDQQRRLQMLSTAKLFSFTGESQHTLIETFFFNFIMLSMPTFCVLFFCFTWGL